MVLWKAASGRLQKEQGIPSKAIEDYAGTEKAKEVLNNKKMDKKMKLPESELYGHHAEKYSISAGKGKQQAQAQCKNIQRK